MRMVLGSRLWKWSAAAGVGAALLVLLAGLALRSMGGPGGQPPQPSGAVVQESGQGQDQASARAQAQQELAAAEETLTRQMSALDALRVEVYVSAEERVERVPLELYVRGVLAGEMPVDFELEALKAQAIAARTYIVKQLAAGGSGGVKGGDVSDTVADQVYVPLRQLGDRWPEEESAQALAKLTRAVQETRGLIMTYNGQPIEASFFSTSNGYTENSEDYWTQSLPYLRSVASPWDEALSPRYEQAVTLTLAEFRRKLGVRKGAEREMKVLEQTEGRRVKRMSIGGKTFTGRQVREKLGLASSQFVWSTGDGEITFTTYGYGHGVGMSQWGANGMALAGKQAKEILQHYYTGVKIEQASKLPEEF
ncbi:stage II sporulation protein D [Paenibacillus sp. 598K]|uniref:stage II sporulation protein D n=1 Tax=Paenibacillus sp. 598K TaxID=1117987 RepID=UPI000FF95966|nr:stage II sporulation protein D [Paenibacillus sp. 598K]GBF78386.1 stage II sporulation protein D [Paenibacillus sp. 598K]